MKLFTCEQYSPEWWTARRGVPSASEFHRVMTAKTLKLAAAHDTYINALIGDLIDLEYPRKDDVANGAMRRGTAMEPKARRMYEYRTGEEVRQVGFCLSTCGRFGCSPDGLVGDDGLLELKNPTAAVHVGWVREGRLPDDYKCQIHGQLIVTGRAWCDFVSYLPGEDLFIVRVEPDKFTAALRDALEEFDSRFKAALAKFQPAEVMA